MAPSTLRTLSSGSVILSGSVNRKDSVNRSECLQEQCSKPSFMNHTTSRFLLFCCGFTFLGLTNLFISQAHGLEQGTGGSCPALYKAVKDAWTSEVAPPSAPLTAASKESFPDALGSLLDEMGCLGGGGTGSEIDPVFYVLSAEVVATVRVLADGFETQGFASNQNGDSPFADKLLVAPAPKIR